jgi:hypothetical protein
VSTTNHWVNPTFDKSPAIISYVVKPTTVTNGVRFVDGPPTSYTTTNGISTMNTVVAPSTTVQEVRRVETVSQPVAVSQVERVETVTTPVAVQNDILVEEYDRPQYQKLQRDYRGETRTGVLASEETTK